MTYSGDPVKTGNSVLKSLVVIALVFTAYWAVRGGYDEVVIPVTTTTSTSTTSTTTSSTTTSTTTTTIPEEPEGEGEEGEGEEGEGEGGDG